MYIDGRADVYGDSFLNEFMDTYRAEIDWRNTFDKYEIQSVLLPPHTALTTALRREPGWKNIFEDKQAVIFTRTDLRGSPLHAAAPGSKDGRQ